MALPPIKYRVALYLAAIVVILALGHFTSRKVQPQEVPETPSGREPNQESSARRWSLNRVYAPRLVSAGIFRAGEAGGRYLEVKMTLEGGAAALPPSKFDWPAEMFRLVAADGTPAGEPDRNVPGHPWETTLPGVTLIFRLKTPALGSSWPWKVLWGDPEAPETMCEFTPSEAEADFTKPPLLPARPAPER